MTETELRSRTSGERVSLQIQLGIFVLVLATVFPFMHHRGEQQASRYAATAAAWDLGTLEVTEYAALLGRDGAVVDGTAYTDKAPGQPLLAVPFYGIFRLAGGGPLGVETQDPDLGLWWLTVWSAGVPLALLAVLMYKWSKETQPETALPATLTLVFGSLLLVYGTLLFGHVLAALLGFGMFLLVRREEAPGWSLVLAGVLGGFAVLTEYPLALVVAIVTAAAFVVHGARAWRVVVGGIPAVAILGLYNTALFGGPLVFSYQWNVFHGIKEEARGTFDTFRWPSVESLSEVLFSQRGLLIATPVIAIALVGAVLMWRRGRRTDAVVALLAFLSMLGIQMFWPTSFAGGAGPRYVTPGLAFLVAPLAVAWKRWRLITGGLAALSIVTMTVATLTNPQLGEGFKAGLGYWTGELVSGNLAPTLYTQVLPGWGWLLHLATIAAALLAVARFWRLERNTFRELP